MFLTSACAMRRARAQNLPELNVDRGPITVSSHTARSSTATRSLGIRLTELPSVYVHRADTFTRYREVDFSAPSNHADASTNRQWRDAGSFRQLRVEQLSTPVFTPTLPTLSAKSSRRHGAGASARRSRTPANAKHPSAGSQMESSGMPVAVAIKKYWKFLSPTDRDNILRYKYVWYVPVPKSKAHKGTNVDVDKVGKRGGEHKSRALTESGHRGHVAFRFEKLSVLGAGNFGQVTRCLDHKRKREVALKMICTDESFEMQARIEVAALERTKNGSPYVVEMLEHFVFRDQVCVVFELLHINLYEWLASREFKGLDMSIVQRITWQMMHALQYLKRIGVVHCDVKPENILLTRPGAHDVKLIDFGSACFKDKTTYTYIQSRFYRAPEVMLGIDYGHSIDVWSLACVVAELFTGRTLFTGDDEAQQLSEIAKKIGPPPRSVIHESTNSDSRVDVRVLTARDDDDDARTGASTSTRKASARSRAVVECDDARFNSFLRQALRWDKARRLTPERALTHRFLNRVALR